MIEPLAFDYVHKESIQSNGLKWLGNGYALKKSEEISRIIFILGPPSIKENMETYNKALNIIHEIPINHEFVKEEEYSDYAIELHKYMMDHGLLQES